MNRLNGKYTNKKYKFAFLNKDTNEWFIANKKPVNVKIKKQYFDYGDVYQYRIKTLGYEIANNYWNKEYYTEYEFVNLMIKYTKQELKDNQQRHKNHPTAVRFIQNIQNYKQQVKFFKNRKKEIEKDPNYMWELLKV